MRRASFVAMMAIGLGLGALGTSVWLGDTPLISEAEAKSTAKSAATGDLAPQYLYLIRSSLGAVQDANRTGNYSVLRDLAAPSFQARHSPADLAELFAPARRKPIDLAVAAFVSPVVTDVTREASAHLSLSGYLPAGTERITFTLLFEAVQSHWRLAGVSLSSVQEVDARKQAAALKP